MQTQTFHCYICKETCTNHHMIAHHRDCSMYLHTECLVKWGDGSSENGKIVCLKCSETIEDENKIKEIKEMYTEMKKEGPEKKKQKLDEEAKYEVTTAVAAPVRSRRPVQPQRT